LKKAIREMKMERTRVAVGQHQLQVLGFADDLSIENSLEDTERAAEILEQRVGKIGLKKPK